MSAYIAAYATLTATTGRWQIAAYLIDPPAPVARVPLAYEGVHGSAFDPRTVGSEVPALREVNRILTESGLTTTAPWQQEVPGTWYAPAKRYTAP